MNLRVGLRVYIGYCPDRYCKGDAGRARLETGEITSGPLAPGAGRYGGKFTEQSWNVSTDSGSRIRVAASILFPIDDPDQSTETTDRKAVEA